MKLHEALIIEDMPFQGSWQGEYCKIISGTLTIYEGFYFDGLSYARDGKRDSNGLPLSWRASALHDCLYNEHNSPLTRKQVDKLLLKELKKIGFTCAYLYYLGVRAFGWMFWRS